MGAQRVAVVAERDLGATWLKLRMVQKISGLYSSNSWAVGTRSAAPRARYGPLRPNTSAPLLPNPAAASNAASRSSCCRLSVRAVVTACSSAAHKSGAASAYLSPSAASRAMSKWIIGI